MRAHLPVLESVRFVAARSRRVFFQREAVAPAVQTWGSRIQAESVWSHPCHIAGDNADSVQWFFVLDVLNHCFWPDSGAEPWSVDYRGERYSGYWGLAAALKRALEEGIPIVSAEYLSSMGEKNARTIFRGQGTIPLLGERIANLREAGRLLSSRWNGHIVHLLEAAHRDVVEIVPMIVDSFPSFRDEARFEGRTVYFWKRAQLFASDIHHAFFGRGWGALKNMSALTAFADYKLPQVLRELGILQYDEKLARHVDERRNIVPRSSEEIEIRALTIWAVEHLKEEFHRQGQEVTSAWVDNWLWGLGQGDEFRARPYHRCRTIYY